MNKFYNLNIILQWIMALIMLVLSFIALKYWLDLFDQSRFWIVLVFILIPVLQFLLAPINKLIGLFKYLSPMLLVYAPKKSKYDIHNGTSFDYLFHFKWRKRGRKWQQQMLEYYLDGLLIIITELEDKKIPDSIEIRGSSYFFSEQTSKRLGFRLKKTGIIEKLNLLINYLDLFWMYSLAKGKLAFPNLGAIKTASCSGKELLTKKEELMKLRDYLSRKGNEQ